MLNVGTVHPGHYIEDNSMGGSVAGSLISGGLSYLGGLQANSAASAAADKANDFALKTFKNRYQWTTQDMTKAGLNPMLAYIQGGGSPPSGFKADTPGGNKLQAGVSSALQAASLKANIDNTQADTALKATQARESASRNLNIIQQTSSASSAARRAAADLPSQLDQASVDKGWLGQGVRRVEKFLEPVTTLLHGANTGASAAATIKANF